MKMAAKFSMVRLNVDQQRELNLKYKDDGGYVPRTIILYPSGKIMHDLYAQENKYKYYIDPNDPGALHSLMSRALKNK